MSRPSMQGTYRGSAYDWNFSVFGIPVRVIAWFWLMTAILGWNSVEAGVDVLLGWMIVCFISILIHELGHALTARQFGYRPRITLYQMGGLAEFEHIPGQNLWRSILISLAGPMAGFALYGIVCVLEPTVIGPLRNNMDPHMSLLTASVIDDFKWVNLGWGLLNLLPILPLDGGQVCRDFCLMLNRSHGLIWALRISVLVAIIAAILSYESMGTYSAVLFGLLGMESFRELQLRRRAW